jgi:quercetin dioxygenase-like cupin family protein
MSPLTVGSFASLLCLLQLVALPSPDRPDQYAQPSRTRQYPSGFESDRVRVRAISAEPGARLASPQAGNDRVLVFLTADLDGRMPSAEAIWQPAGEPERENRGRVRADAIAIDLKPASGAAASGTPYEALAAHDGVESRVLIDNPRVTVMKLRYLPYSLNIDFEHTHPQDAVVVYLSGGYTWPAVERWGYPLRVRRGEFDIVPAQTFHCFGNGSGNDALELLVIIPK